MYAIQEKKYSGAIKFLNRNNNLITLFPCFRNVSRNRIDVKWPDALKNTQIHRVCANT